MALTRFNRSGLSVTPWKNGGGTTSEIVCQPAGANMDSFDWRVSIAHIASDGPFSPFPGVDRVITLLDGAGVRLHTPDGHIDHRLDQPLAPFAFAGEAPVQADLLDGDCHDFNVMTRRAGWRASVTVLQADADLPTRAQGLLYAVRGRWSTSGGHTLQAHEGLWWHDTPTRWSLHRESADAALIAVLIERTTP